MERRPAPRLRYTTRGANVPVKLRPEHEASLQPPDLGAATAPKTTMSLRNEARRRPTCSVIPETGGRFYPPLWMKTRESTQGDSRRPRSCCDIRTWEGPDRQAARGPAGACSPTAAHARRLPAALPPGSSTCACDPTCPTPAPPRPAPYLPRDGTSSTGSFGPPEPSVHPLPLPRQAAQLHTLNDGSPRPLRSPSGQGHGCSAFSQLLLQPAITLLLA